MLQTIGSTNSGQGFDPWIELSIFPNAQLPTSSASSAVGEKRAVQEEFAASGQV